MPKRLPHRPAVFPALLATAAFALFLATSARAALIYSTYFGGTGIDQTEDVAVEDRDAVYLTGRTFSANFPLVNAFQSSNVGGEAFVLKIDPEANAVRYSTFFGGTGFDYGTSIAVDRGEAYITGGTNSLDLPVTGELQSIYHGGMLDAFVARFDRNGGLVYSAYLGGSDSDAGSGIAVDASSRDMIVVGNTESWDFPSVNGPQATIAGDTDFFVTRLDAGGNFVFSTFFGGSAGETGPRVALDGSGNLIVAGSTNSLDLPVLNAFQQGFGGGISDVAVVKLDAGGAPLLCTYYGGWGIDVGLALATYQDDMIVAGTTASADFPTAGPVVQGGLRGGSDAFVFRLDPSGAPVYATFLGGSDDEGGRGVAVDGQGNAYVTGGTDSIDFPLASPYQTTLNGNYDAFVTVLDDTGSHLLFSSYLGGIHADWGTAIAVGPGRTYVAGNTSSVNFPLVQPFQHTLQGMDDLFLSVFDSFP